MPQLDPVHYFSQLSFTLATLFLFSYLLATYVLPQQLMLNVVRSFLAKL